MGHLEEPSPAITRMLGDFMRLPLPQGPTCHWDLELDYRWRRKNVEASVGREGSHKLIIYTKKKSNISFNFILIYLCTSRLFFFKLLQLICFPFGNNKPLDGKTMPPALQVNFKNFGHTTKNKILLLVKLVADLSSRL